MIIVIYLIIASLVAGAWVFWKRSYEDETYGDFNGFEIMTSIVLGAFWPISLLPTIAIQAAKYCSDRRRR